MLERWHQLNEREQKLVIAMSAAVLIFILYSLIWQPLNENIKKTQAKVERQEQLLTWVKEKTALYKQAVLSGQHRNQGGSLSSIVNRTANQSSIVIARMQPQGEDLQVWIDEVPFNTLLNWLGSLASDNGISIKAVDLANSDTPGVVRVRRLQLGK